jgi:N-acetylmuramoyl-L-alanine amidase
MNDNQATPKGQANTRQQPTYLFILDNGHASTTPGKRSPALLDGRQLLEYEFNRDVVARIHDLCIVSGIHTHVLVPERDVDISLSTRAARANAIKTNLKKMLVSVHANAAGDGIAWHPARGIETFALRPGGAADAFAQIMQTALVMRTRLSDRGVKYANFAILRLTDCPAILTENGFFTNPQECLKLLDPAFRQMVAEAHVNAMMQLQRSNQ